MTWRRWPAFAFAVQWSSASVSTVSSATQATKETEARACASEPDESVCCTYSVAASRRRTQREQVCNQHIRVDDVSVRFISGDTGVRALLRGLEHCVESIAKEAEVRADDLLEPGRAAVIFCEACQPIDVVLRSQVDLVTAACHSAFCLCGEQSIRKVLKNSPTAVDGVGPVFRIGRAKVVVYRRELLYRLGDDVRNAAVDGLSHGCEHV